MLHRRTSINETRKHQHEWCIHECGHQTAKSCTTSVLSRVSHTWFITGETCNQRKFTGVNDGDLLFRGEKHPCACQSVSLMILNYESHLWQRFPATEKTRRQGHLCLKVTEHVTLIALIAVRWLLWLVCDNYDRVVPCITIFNRK